MPKRFYGETRRVIVAFLLQRDGDKCGGCGNSLSREKIDVDHADGNPNNNDPMNLRLMHHTCNAKAHSDRVKTALSQLPRMGERERKSFAAALVRESDGFAPNRNVENEPLFRRWAFARVKLAGAEGRDLLFGMFVADGAEFIGASTQAVYHYTAKLCSATYGCLERVRVKEGPGKGKVSVRFVRAEDYGRSVDDLERQYPWEGARVKDTVPVKPKTIMEALKEA